jgi:hypothetical protein
LQKKFLADQAVVAAAAPQIDVNAAMQSAEKEGKQ